MSGKNRLVSLLIILIHNSKSDDSVGTLPRRNGRAYHVSYQVQSKWDKSQYDLCNYNSKRKELLSAAHPQQDKRCGSFFGNGECDAKSGNPCCSAHGYCGNSDEHCKCVGCLDYRGKHEKHNLKSSR